MEQVAVSADPIWSKLVAACAAQTKSTTFAVVGSLTLLKEAKLVTGAIVHELIILHQVQ